MTANDNQPQIMVGRKSVEALALLLKLYKEGPTIWHAVTVGDALVICELKGWVECGAGVPNSDNVMTRLTDKGREDARRAYETITGKPH